MAYLIDAATEDVRAASWTLLRGWTPLSEETLDVANQTEGDTKEGLYFGREVSANSPDAGMPLHGPNQWPSPVRASGLITLSGMLAHPCKQNVHCCRLPSGLLAAIVPVGELIVCQKT